MSGRTKRERPVLPFPRALDLARKLVDDLAPHVQRTKVVGSLRRQSATIPEIDILVEPRALQGDMFGVDGPDLQPIRGVAASWGEITKSGDRYMKILLSGAEDFPVDLFLCHPPAEWGSLLAIRTGPVELSTRAVSLLRGRGFLHEHGRVVDAKSGQTVPTPDEETFFALAGLPCLPATRRGRPEAMREIANPVAPGLFERRDAWAWERKEEIDARAHARATDPATSHEAAAKVGSSFDSMIDVLRILEAIGTGIDEAIVDAAPRMAVARTPQRIRSARADAERIEWVRHTGELQTTRAGGRSRVWELTPTGRAALDRARGNR
jgi:hypothetical protein